MVRNFLLTLSFLLVASFAFAQTSLGGKVIDTEKGASIKRIVNIQLFNDMSNLKNIYVIKDFDKHEIMNLENNSNE